MLRTEHFSVLSHCLGAFTGVLGMIILILRAETLAEFVVSLIYGTALVLLFTASTVYHMMKRCENEHSVWRRIDHFAIFLMIAGTYTPVCWLYLSGGWCLSILSVQWALVVFGFFFRFLWLDAPRWLYTAIYLIMGWTGLVPLPLLYDTMPKILFMCVFLGGGLYTAGALFYMFKWPQGIPGFGFHELFHIFILGGAAVHYFVVFMSL